LIAAGARSLKIPHQTVRNPLHVSSRYAKQAHAFVQLIGRVRTALGQLLKLRPDHTELVGDPIQPASVNRVQLAAPAPPCPQL
jgi:hypothetical protein